MSQTFVYQEGQDGPPIIIDCIPYPNIPSDRTATVVKTDTSDPANATKTRMRVKTLDNPKFIQNMIRSASTQPTQVQIQANGKSAKLSLTPAKGNDSILMRLKDTAVWLPTDDEDDTQVQALTGVETAAILFMVSVVAGVAVYSMSNDDNSASCDVEVESTGDNGQGSNDDGGGTEK